MECEQADAQLQAGDPGQSVLAGPEPAPSCSGEASLSRKPLDWLGEAHTLWSIICFIY